MDIPVKTLTDCDSTVVHLITEIMIRRFITESSIVHSIFS